MQNFSFLCCSLIDLQNSSLTIVSSIFKNLELSTNFVFFESKRDSNIKIQDTEFKNITFQKPANLFHISELSSNGSTIIFSSMFKKIKFLKNILYFENIMAPIWMDSLIFEKNIIKSQIINIQSSFNISIANVIINFTNYDDGLPCEQQCGGGAIKLMDILYKKLDNISIIFMLSTHSTLAVKIIDTLTRKAQPIYQPVNKTFIQYYFF